MEKDKVFFSEEGELGMTSTKANFYSNLAKEAYSSLETKLGRVGFLNIYIESLDSKECKVLKAGVKDLSWIQPAIEELAAYKCLIAWFREALKAKERLISEARNLRVEDLGLQLPDQPSKPIYLTDDDIVGTWDVKKRNEFYTQQTYAAVYGGYVHKGGSISTSLKELNDCTVEQRSTEGYGKDLLIKTYEASVGVEEVEKLFFQLQQIQVGYQSRLNSMLHEIEVAKVADQTAKDEQYKLALVDYNNEYRRVNQILEAERNSRVNKASSLKIRIPNHLMDIFKKVSEMGKEE